MSSHDKKRSEGVGALQCLLLFQGIQHQAGMDLAHQTKGADQISDDE